MNVFSPFLQDGPEARNHVITSLAWRKQNGRHMKHMEKDCPERSEGKSHVISIVTNGVGEEKRRTVNVYAYFWIRVGDLYIRWICII